MTAAHKALEMIANGEPMPLSNRRALRRIIRNITPKPALEPDTAEITYLDDAAMRAVAGSLARGVRVSPGTLRAFGNSLVPPEVIHPDAHIYRYVGA